MSKLNVVDNLPVSQPPLIPQKQSPLNVYVNWRNRKQSNLILLLCYTPSACSAVCAILSSCGSHIPRNQYATCWLDPALAGRGVEQFNLNFISLLLTYVCLYVCMYAVLSFPLITETQADAYSKHLKCIHSLYIHVFVLRVYHYYYHSISLSSHTHIL